MRIDDPKVQAYISGQLSESDEAALLEELQNHPEVSDLADTLKRTQKLINQDKEEGSVPEIAKPKDLSPIEKTFEPIMGKNWKVELGLISGTIAVLFLMVIIVPILKSVSSKTEEAQSSQFQKDTLEAMESKKAGGSGEIRERDSTGSSSTQLSGQFEADLVGDSYSNNYSVTHSQVSGLSLSKTASLTAPIQIDFEAGAKIIQAIKRGKNQIPPDFNLAELVNSFPHQTTKVEEESVVGPTLLIELEGSKSPWGKGFVLTSTLVAVGADAEGLSSQEKRFLFLGLSDGLKNFFEKESEATISTNLEAAFSGFSGESEVNRLVVYLGARPSAEQALALKKWSLKPSSRLSIVDVTGELQGFVREFIGPETNAEYIVAPTPFMLKKAFFNYLAGQEGPIHQIRLHLNSADPNRFKLGIVGANREQTSNASENLKGAWMFPGERGTQVYSLEPQGAEPQPNEKALGVNLNYILSSVESPVRGTSNQVLVQDFSGDISKLHRQAVALSWIGLILKGELTLNQESYKRIAAYIQPLGDKKMLSFLQSVRLLYLE